jgi:galactose oxidase-like protein
VNTVTRTSLAAAVAAIAACSSDSSPFRPPDPAPALSVTPSIDTVLAGDTVRFYTRDSQPATWTVSDSRVAQIENQSGASALVRAVHEGTTTVTAAEAARTASAVLVAVGSKLVFTVQPSNATAGVTLAPGVAVTIEDPSGNPLTGATNSVTVALGATPGAATLWGTTAVTAVDGVATFGNLSIQQAGSGYTLRASSSGAIGATSAPFAITPTVATALAVSGVPGSLIAGMAVNVVVTARDASGNIAYGYTGTLHFTSTDGAAELPQDYAFVGADAASHVFRVIFRSPFTQTLTATDAARSISASAAAFVTFANAELYDPVTRKWTVTGGMRLWRNSATATLLSDGKVLVAGGACCGTPLYGVDALFSTTTSDVYDPATGTWIVTGSMSVPRQQHTLTLLHDGRVLVVGGGTGTGPNGTTAITELYSPSTGMWTPTGSLNVALAWNTTTLLNDGTVLAAGGLYYPPILSSPSGDTTLAELYDPATGMWTATGSMTVGRMLHTATLLRDGRVLVVGGNTGLTGSVTASAELYDPVTRTWTATGSMGTPRGQHTATLLQDGTVLVTGGYPPTASTELYEPGTGTWTTIGSMSVQRVGHTATLLNDGKVLVAGGGVDAELYDPTTQTWTATSKMNTERAEHTATLLNNGAVLVSGGGLAVMPPCVGDACGMASRIAGLSAGRTWLPAARAPGHLLLRSPARLLPLRR